MTQWHWSVYAILATLCAIYSSLWIEANGWRLLLNLLGVWWGASAGIALHKENLKRKLEMMQRCADALKRAGHEL
jgi:hypothetical protein